jgi:hypothetical protein
MVAAAMLCAPAAAGDPGIDPNEPDVDPVFAPAIDPALEPALTPVMQPVAMAMPPSPQPEHRDTGRLEADAVRGQRDPTGRRTADHGAVVAQLHRRGHLHRQHHRTRGR